VILQTYNPEHFSIRAARDQDYETFCSQEMAFREALKYPPASRLIQLRISGRDPQRARRLALTLGEHCRALRAADPSFLAALEVMGPIEAALSRIAGHYRWQMLLKSPRSGALHRFVERLLSDHPDAFTNRHVRVVIDVDPLFMM
jgi:primosomal protein N' (replication factor Y)